MWKSDTMRFLRMAFSARAREKFRIFDNPARIALVDPRHDDHRYRNPQDLRVTQAPIRRAIVVGSCLAQAYADYRGFAPHFDCDFVLANMTSALPDSPPAPITDYDFQFVSLPFRAVAPEAGLFSTPYADAQRHADFFAQCCDRLDLMLDLMLRWNREHKLLTFVGNFLVPQQNMLGKLMPRYELRNPVHFVEQLNAHLATRLATYDNVHMVDVDAIAANFGRKTMQDDQLWHWSHGSYLGDWDHEVDTGRIEPIRPVSHYYSLEVSAFFKALWEEVGAAYRILHQIDAVKLVAVDLDDTLWRGVMAEDGLSHAEPLEGWPLGFAEALATLKKRGILLAIVSKNDEAKIAAMWDGIFGSLLQLSDFAIRKINWRPKAENMAALLQEANILPRNVVFIDDNPVERAAMQAAYPDIRVLGDHPYLLRRILLWAPETQVPVISEESARRTDMVQAQVVREAARSRLSREAFLAGLDVRVAPATIATIDDPGFARAMELVNKTNQFNSSGERWTLGGFAALFARGGWLATFAVTDSYSRYGVVAVAVVEGPDIRQFVMSCRVIGLDIERAALAWLVSRMRPGGGERLTARLVETADNLPARDLYVGSGFVRDGELWALAGVAPALPAHVAIEPRTPALT